MWGFRLGGEPQPGRPADQCQDELYMPQTLSPLAASQLHDGLGAGDSRGRNERAGVERNELRDSAAIKSKVNR